METSIDRQLHQQRALQERVMTARAVCTEAAIAHDELNVLHIAACAKCAHGLTAECTECDMQPLCDAAEVHLA
ncbi:hypothetical protein [Sphingomonas sp. 28-62-11]|uniref:hypothetical protein n=1 Tax=Sphingomonas sp. 28-62-11 TaxID=1970432 RepID=UPI000BCF4A29|nr:MAG: hypothetical protein B7Y49_02600 [Sphingomonas sp. 28-62-11]